MITKLARLYMTWASRNGPLARQLENILRIATMYVVDLNQLPQLEAATCAGNMFRIVNDCCVPAYPDGSDDSPTTFEAVTMDCDQHERRAAAALQLVSHMQCLIELIARGAFSHMKVENGFLTQNCRSYAAPAGEKTWMNKHPHSLRGDAAVVLVEVLKALLHLLSRRRLFSVYFRRVIATFKFYVASADNLGLQSSRCASRSATPSTIRLPVVEIDDDIDCDKNKCTESLRLRNTSEWLWLITEIYYTVRSTLFAALLLQAARRRTSSRSGMWRVWLLTSCTEFIMYCVGTRAKWNVPPTLRIPIGNEANQGYQSSKPLLPDAMVPQNARTRALLLLLCRDPVWGRFFAKTVDEWIVNGFIARRLPILGPLLSMTVRYNLAMRHCSLLYTSPTVV